MNLGGDLGVRTSEGYICFLPKPHHYDGQDERYAEEMIEYKANANLIQAAPLLYETLKDIMETTTDKLIYEKAKAILSKVNP